MSSLVHGERPAAIIFSSVMIHEMKSVIRLSESVAMLCQVIDFYSYNQYKY